MADKDSVQYAGRKSFIDGRESGGNDIIIRINHTVASDTSTDRVFLVELPAGCQVMDGAVCWDALGASTTMAIGDTSSGARYLAATAVTAVGRASFPTPRAGMNFRPSTAAERILCLTWAGATPTNGAVIEGWVLIQLGT